MAEEQPKVLFRKVGKFVKRGRKRNLSDDNSNSDNDSNVKGHDDEISAVRRPEKIQRPSAFSQSSSRTKSKQSYRRKEDDNGLDNSEVEENQPTTSHLLTTYKSNASIERTGPRDMGATATCEIETEHDKDAQAQFERTQAIAKEMKGKSDDKVYRGMSAYGQFYEKKDSLLGNASSGLNRKGPIRAPTNVRMSTRWDYQPDICKDYKETGFCGFGDSCKFLHDRSDYKHGWEIEREYNEGRYGKADEDPHQFEISDEEDELPFKCLICRNAFIDPIITKCKHYFCEKCALQHFAKSHKCYVCEKGTGGIFTPAKDLIAKLKGLPDKRKEMKKEEEKDAQLSEESDQETHVERLELPPASNLQGENGSDHNLSDSGNSENDHQLSDDDD